MSAPVDPSYYATVAQVIPVLLLTAAVEHRLLSPEGDAGKPNGPEVREHFVAYLGIATLSVFAAVGAVAALESLYSGATQARRVLSQLGVSAAFVLVILPVVYRALFNLLASFPRLKAVVRNFVLPLVLVIMAVWAFVS